MNTWVNILMLELMGAIIFGTAALASMPGSSQVSKGAYFIHQAFAVMDTLSFFSIFVTMIVGAFLFA